MADLENKLNGISSKLGSLENDLSAIESEIVKSKVPPADFIS